MKMKYDTYVCEVTVASHFFYQSAAECEYERDTVAYAVKRFLVQCERFCRECTRESWQLRVAKGRRARRKHDFEYLIPAVLMELPGEWVRLKGKIDEKGVTVDRVEILNEHPVFAMTQNEEQRREPSGLEKKPGHRRNYGKAA